MTTTKLFGIDCVTDLADAVRVQRQNHSGSLWRADWLWGKKAAVRPSRVCKAIELAQFAPLARKRMGLGIQSSKRVR